MSEHIKPLPNAPLPAPRLVVRLVWWWGIYLAIWVIPAFIALDRYGNGISPGTPPLWHLLGFPVLFPIGLEYLVIWLPGATLPSINLLFHIVAFGIYLVHLTVSLRVSRLRSFCGMMVALVVIIFLNVCGWGALFSCFPMQH